MFGSNKRNSDDSSPDSQSDSSSKVDDLLNSLWSVNNFNKDEFNELRDKTMDRMQDLMSSYSDKVQGSLEEHFPWVFSLSSPFFTGREDSAENLWSYPVPSARQYDQCIDAGGKSAWNKDGLWRCLFPQNPEYNNKDKWFSDYSGFLDWRRHMRQVAVKERQQRELEAKKEHESVQNALTKPARFISESDAESAGKRVVSTSVTSETITNNEGQLETKRRVEKWYDDGTKSVKETIENGENKGSSGWFWR
uniref:ARAD1B19624p n=1 Tax=Blastobotrys adeninivorans TaxID=409370 RepID=A0A060T7J2_BLAAD